MAGRGTGYKRALAEYRKKRRAIERAKKDPEHQAMVRAMFHKLFPDLKWPEEKLRMSSGKGPTTTA